MLCLSNGGQLIARDTRTGELLDLSSVRLPLQNAHLIHKHDLVCAQCGEKLQIEMFLEPDRSSVKLVSSHLCPLKMIESAGSNH